MAPHFNLHPIGNLVKEVANAAFVKTSTGFGAGGATIGDVTLMRRVVGPEMGVKASGGIRTREDVRDMIAAGATRIGASAGVQIVSGGQGEDAGQEAAAMGEHGQGHALSTKASRKRFLSRPPSSVQPGRLIQSQHDVQILHRRA